MKIIRIALCAATFLIPCQAVARERADVLIRHAALVDVQRGNIIPDQAIAIEGNTIRSLGPDRTLRGEYDAP